MGPKSITQIIFCIPTRTKQLHAHLKAQTGILIIGFTDLSEKNMGKFEVVCTNTDKLYSLGVSVGRMFVLDKLHIDDKSGY